MESEWYVMRVLRREKWARDVFQEAGFRTYLPMHTIAVMRHGRKHTEEVPLLRSFVFVHGCREDIQTFKTRHPNIQYAMNRLGAKAVPMTVPQREMDNFIRLCESDDSSLRFYSGDDSESLSRLKCGDRVKVMGGVFDGVEARILRIRGARTPRICVAIEGFCAVSVEVMPDLLEKL